MAGLAPAGVICEIMNDDGTMARVPQLVEFCARHGLKMISVAETIRYRMRHENLRPARGRGLHRHRVRGVPDDCLWERVQSRIPRGRGARGGRRPGESAGAHARPLRVRRGVRLHGLRLRPAGARIPARHRRRGRGRPGLPSRNGGPGSASVPARGGNRGSPPTRANTRPPKARPDSARSSTSMALARRSSRTSGSTRSGC